MERGNSVSKLTAAAELGTVLAPPPPALAGAQLIHRRLELRDSLSPDSAGAGTTIYMTHVVAASIGHAPISKIFS